MSTATYGELVRYALEETGDIEEALAAVELALSYGRIELAQGEWQSTNTTNHQGLPGWHNARTGEYRYQQNAPGSRQAAAAPAPTAPRQPVAPAPATSPQQAPPVAPAPQPPSPQEPIPPQAVPPLLRAASPTAGAAPVSQMRANLQAQIAQGVQELDYGEMGLPLVPRLPDRASNRFELRKVPVHLIVGTENQGGGEADKVTAYATPGHPAAKEPLGLIEVGGRYYLEDGNHRFGAAILRGEEEVLARVYPGKPPADGMAFAHHDIHAPRAQKVLDRALKAARKLSAAARKELAALFDKPRQEALPLLAEWLTKYRTQLTDLLSATQLAALLEGAQEVAGHLPSTLAPLANAGVPLPPTLPPAEASALLDRLRDLDLLSREKEIYLRPPSEQRYLRNTLGAGDPPPPPPVPSLGSAGGPGAVHLETIEEAARLLAEKHIARPGDFRRLDDAARHKAFTVAGADALETMTRVRDLLAENVEGGASLEDFQKAVAEEGLGGTFLSDGHLETVFRTNVQSAFSDGQMSVLRQPYVRSGFPYARYDAIHDDRVRDNHLALESLGLDQTNVYRVDDPVFETFRPPWDWQDRCGWVPTSIAQAADMGVKEAQEWLRTGAEPSPPARVPWPDFRPPAAFQRSVGAAPLSLTWSLLPLNVELAQDPSDPSIWHGPTAPGPGWVDAGTGPRGGKMWKYQGGGGAQQPAAQQPPMQQQVAQQQQSAAQQPVAGQDIAAQFQALPPEAQAFVQSLLNMPPEQLAAFKQSLGGGQPQAPAPPPVQPPSPQEPIPPQAVPPLLREQGGGSVGSDLASLNKPDIRTGLPPLLPQLYDRLKEKHPSLTEPQFHALLRDWQQQDLLTMQSWGGGGPDQLARQTGYAITRFPEHPRGGYAAWVQLRPGAAEKLAQAPAALPASSPQQKQAPVTGTIQELAAPFIGKTGALTPAQADDLIARARSVAGDRKLGVKGFAEFAHLLGFRLHGTKGQMLQQFENTVNRIAVSTGQTQFSLNDENEPGGQRKEGPLAGDPSCAGSAPPGLTSSED